MNKQNCKIGIAHPRLGRGGSEAAAMWAIEALKTDYDVSLITAGDVDMVDLNEFYGTNVLDGDILIRRASLPGFLQHLKVADAFFGALYQRHCQKIAHEFDVLINTYNLCDFGVPAIQCIADFSWDEDIRTSFDPPPQGARGLFHRIALLQKCYLVLARLVARTSGRDFFSGEDLVLANSYWSAGIIKDKYGPDIDVLYPPVFANVPNIPFKEREMGFVCIECMI